MAVTRKKIMTALACLVSICAPLLSSLPADAKVIRWSSDRPCYGETVEVQLWQWNPTEKKSEPGVILSIPLGTNPRLRRPRQVSADWSKEKRKAWEEDCLDEPILIESVYFYFNHHPKPQIGLTQDGPLVRRILLRGRGTNSNILSGRYVTKEKIASLPAVPDGFKEFGHGLAYQSPGNPGNAGLFIVEPGYQTPTGERMGFCCGSRKPFGMNKGGLECSTTYSIAGKVGAKYWFTHGKVPYSEWLELDQRVRRAVEMMIVDE